MAFLPGGQRLIDYSSGVNPATNQAGTAYELTSADNTPDDLTFSLTYDLLQSGGATSPTATLTIVVSMDGTNWIPIVIVSTNGTTLRQTQGVSGFSCPKYIKASLAVAGGTAPVVDCKVYLFWSQAVTATAV